MKPFNAVSYRTSKRSKTWKRGYMKTLWTERLTTPIVKAYELYDTDKTTLLKTYTPNEAEKALGADLLCRGQDLKR